MKDIDNFKNAVMFVVANNKDYVSIQNYFIYKHLLITLQTVFQIWVLIFRDLKFL